MTFTRIAFCFTATMLCCTPTWANDIQPSAIVPSLQSLHGLSTEDLQASIDLYKAQINQDNLLMLSQTMQQQVQQHTQNPALQKSIEQGIGILYDAEQAKVLNDIAQKQLPQILEKSTPIIAKNLEQAVQQLDSKQIAEAINHPEMQKNINKLAKIFDILRSP